MGSLYFCVSECTFLSIEIINVGFRPLLGFQIVVRLPFCTTSYRNVIL